MSFTSSELVTIASHQSELATMQDAFGRHAKAAEAWRIASKAFALTGDVRHAESAKAARAAWYASESRIIAGHGV
jgi:hypothetical protein